MAKLCPRGKAAAKRKFKVYPSAPMQICMRLRFALAKSHQVVKEKKKLKVELLKVVVKVMSNRRKKTKYI
jgi:hypothetical protein